MDLLYNGAGHICISQSKIQWIKYSVQLEIFEGLNFRS